MYRVTGLSSRRRSPVRLACFLCCLCAWSCADATGVTEAQPKARVVLPELSLAVSVDALGVGDSALIAATVRDRTGRTLQGEPVTWSSSDSNTVRVSSTGVVRGVMPGRATITATATAAGASAQLPITVLFARVAVDFASATHTRSAGGIVSGVSRTNPTVDRITPLRPQLWRGGILESAVRMAAYAPVVEFMISGSWGNLERGWPFGRPFEDWSRYEAHIRERAAATRGRAFIYDLWNEPDNPGFWDAAEELVFETYLRTFRAVRAELGPDVPVSGPGTTRFDLPFIIRFLDYCLAHGCEVNVLSWHELGADRPLSRIPENIRLARRIIMNNPRYAPLKLRAIHINEVVGRWEYANPAINLYYMHLVELGGADAAARTCWVVQGENSCWNGTMGGLLTRQTLQPRAVWWALKQYADGAHSRVASRTTDPRIISLASAAAPTASAAQVLIAYTDVDGPPGPGLTALGVRLDNVNLLPFAQHTESVRIVVTHIPAAEDEALLSLETVFARDVALSGGTARFTLENLERNGAYVVTISASPGVEPSTGYVAASSSPGAQTRR